MAGFPWSELGLDGPADEGAIRRAYAARLKIVRPDVDPAGFQRLVQARDIALRAIQHTAQRPLLHPDFQSKREEQAPEGLRPQPNAQGTTEPIELPAARQLLPSQRARPVIVDLNPPARLPTDAKPIVVDNQVPEGNGPEAVLMLFSAFVEAWRSDLGLPPIAPILKLLSEQSIVARQKLEVEALRVVAALFDKGLFDGKTPEERRNAAKSLIVGLDDDYAWAHSDRRLYQMMPQASADQMARLLRVLRDWEKTGLPPRFAPASQDGIRKQHGWVPGLAVLGIVALLNIATWSTRRPASTSAPIYLPQPTSPAFHFRQGVAYDSAGQLDRAIEEYGGAIKFNPYYYQAYYNRGLDYASTGQLDRAIKDYDQAIRLNPDNPDIFVSRGVAYDGKGQYDRTIQDYDQAIRLKPEYALAFVNRGIAYANQENYDRAIRDYDAAIGLNLEDADALLNRGQAKRAKGDVAGGEADIARAEQINSSPPRDQ